MGIMDKAKDMADNAKDKMNDTDIDDKAKAKLQELRNKHSHKEDDSTPMSLS